MDSLHKVGAYQLLFLLYINDIVDMFTDNVAIKLFADDKNLHGDR